MPNTECVKYMMDSMTNAELDGKVISSLINC